MSDLFVYYWSDFVLHNSEDDEADEYDAEYYEEQNRYIHLVETKFKNVLPLKFGFFHKGMNYIQIYPYGTIGEIVHPDNYVFMNGKRMNGNESIGLYLPYQDKKLAKEISIEWLQQNHYDFEAKILKDSHVCTRKLMQFSDGWSRGDHAEAKKIDNEMWKKIE